MSKFKLDFDIGEPVRRIAKRVPCPSGDAPRPPAPKTPSTSPPAPVDPRRRDSRDFVEKPSADDEDDDKDDGTHGNRGKGLRVSRRQLGLAIGGGLLFWVFWWCVRPSAPATSRLRPQRNACRQRHTPPLAPVVVCQNHCRGTDVCVARFDTPACADRVQTVHYHSPDGTTRRIPAAYERVPNSSMFFVRGDSAVFQPARCQAQTHAVVVHRPDAAQRLHAHLAWTAPPASTRFRLVRADTGETLAELDAHFVQDRCNADHCVYKLETHCPRPFATHVLSVDTGTPAPTFLFCD